MVRTLLDHGAAVDTRSACENTALHLAARNGHACVVEVLLEMGADACAERAVRREVESGEAVEKVTVVETERNVKGA